MARVKLQFRRDGFAEIRTAPKVMAMLNDIADGVAASSANASGGEYVVRRAEETGGKVRGRAAVVTADIHAIVSEYRDHTMKKHIASNGGGPQNG